MCISTAAAAFLLVLLLTGDRGEFDLLQVFFESATIDIKTNDLFFDTPQKYYFVILMDFILCDV